jgi:hypothetical protein
MKKIKNIISLTLFLSFLALMPTSLVLGSSNTGSDNGWLDLSNVYTGGLQTKAEIVSFLQVKVDLVEMRINSSELIKLTRIPTDLRNNVLSLNLAASNSLSSMLTKAQSENDILKIKSGIQKIENSSSANKMLVLYDQSTLLLKNYNRFYDTLQNSYKVVNDAINYIDIHHSGSDIYFGLPAFDEKTYNNEIAPLRNELVMIKTEKLDVLKASLDLKMQDLNKYNFISISSKQADDARRDVLNMLVLDLPVYKTGYSQEIKNIVIDRVDRLTDIIENQK